MKITEFKGNELDSLFADVIYKISKSENVTLGEIQAATEKYIDSRIEKYLSK